jgi:asparagine synthetase B (glutamine-hydrolysing)
LYEKYGKTFLEMLSGEFAIIIVDYTENEVLIGVDTFGCKPLFISNFNGLGIATYKSGLDRLGFKNAEKMQANTVLIYDLKTFILKEKIQLTIFDLCQHKNTFEDYHKTFSQMITQRYKNTTKKIRSGNV